MPEANNAGSIDWNLIATFATLSIAILAPFITAICTNFHQRHLKKLELKHAQQMEYYQKCCTAFDEFYTEAAYQIYSTTSNIFKYKHSYHVLFMYVPQEYWDKLVSLNNAIMSKDKTKIDNLYLEITKILASLLQEQQKSIPV